MGVPGYWRNTFNASDGSLAIMLLGDIYLGIHIFVVTCSAVEDWLIRESNHPSPV